MEEFYYDDDNEEGYTSGYNFADGFYWFDGWFDVKVGEEKKFLDDGTYQTTKEEYEQELKTIEGIFDYENFYTDYETAIDCGIEPSYCVEPNADNWDDLIKECLDGDYKIVGVHK